MSANPPFPRAALALAVGLALLWGCNSQPSQPAQQPPVEAAAGEPMGQQPPGAGAEGEAARRSLEQDKREALSQRFLETGKQAYYANDLGKAYQDLASALQMNPNNKEAEEYFNRVGAALQRRPEAVRDQTTTSADLIQARIEAARLRVDTLRKRGEQLFSEGDYAGAIVAFNDALTIVKFGPFGVAAGNEEAELRRMIANAEAKDREQKREREAARARDIRERKSQEEAAEKRRMEERIDLLLRRAEDEMRRENYEEAEKLYDHVLRLEPNHQKATDGKRVAASNRHRHVEETTKEEFAENWKRAFESLIDSTQIQTDVMRVGSDWEEIQKRRPKEFSPELSQDVAEEQAILNRLREQEAALQFTGEPLDKVLDFFHTITGINFVISKGVREKLTGDDFNVTLSVPSIKLDKGLALVCDLKNLKYQVRDGIVHLLLPEETRLDKKLEMYDVRDLISPLPDFPGVEISLNPGSSEAAAPEATEEKNVQFESDKLIELIRQNIAKETWEGDPTNTITIKNGTLVVRQSREVHGQLSDMLAGLRKSAGLMVNMDVRFLTVEDNFLEEIGVDFRGLGDDSQSQGRPGRGTDAIMDDFGARGAGGFGDVTNPLGPGTGNDSGGFYSLGNNGDIRSRSENLFDQALGNPDVLTGSGGLAAQWTFLDDTEAELILRAVRKSERVQTITAPRITVYNTERANVTILNQVSYIKDFDAEIAQAAAIVEPIVDVIQDGVILDVRPIVSADRKFITLELRPTVANLRRPIPTFTASVANGTPVTLELPELEIQRIRTTVTIPDNSTLLLGGLKFSEERNAQSGIPFLNKIPIVSFFANRKGTFIQKKNLLILLKARVVIVDEHAPRTPETAR